MLKYDPWDHQARYSLNYVLVVVLTSVNFEILSVNYTTLHWNTTKVIAKYKYSTVQNQSISNKLRVTLWVPQKVSPHDKIHAFWNLAIVYRSTWLGNTIIIFIIKQICWNEGHVDLTVHNTVLLDIKYNTCTILFCLFIKFTKQIGKSLAKIINTKVNSGHC